jgi:DNA-binding transcriptional ArsR family regulator
VTTTRASADGSTEEIATGTWRTPHEQLPGVKMGEDVRTARIEMLLQDPEIVAAPGSGALLAAPTLEASLDGGARWPSAVGRVVVDGKPTDLRGERLEIQGPALRIALGEARPVPGGATSLAPPATSAALAGEAESVRVAGRELVPAGVVASPTALAATAAGLVGAGILLWVLARLGVGAALYSRITRSRVLTNDTRRAAYDRIVARPGLHVAELSRDLGVGRVVLQHHLHMLEAHHLVVPRAVGRVKAYYPSGAALDPDAARAEATLKDASRSRVLAEVLAARDGISQKEIAQRTGFSQRLVSYHVGLLEGTLVVRAEGRRPRLFVPGPRAPQAGVQVASPA